MKKYTTLFLLLFVVISYSQKNKFIMNSNMSIEELLSKMTIEEKAGQLNLIPLRGTITTDDTQMIRAGKVGSILKSNGAERNREIQQIAVEESRLGIPILFQEDVIHGYKTIAPVPLAEAASWDIAAIRKSASIAAKEAAASGIHLTYAPMVDVSRDPRWGRLVEAAGEDPYLGSLIAAARVKGFQESNTNNSNILACVKHYVGYGASLAGRDYNIQDFSERKLREIYLPPFQAAIDAGVSSVMCAYTTYNGVPLTSNKFLLKDVLRKEMGFENLVMTDWSTISNLVKIGFAENDTIATKMALESGIDMDMFSGAYVKLVPYLVKEGLVSEDVIDSAVLKVLELKKKVGLFKNPYAYFDVNREKTELFSDENYEATKEIAIKSMVLLKNENNILPLSKKKQKIAVIGPFAKAKKDLNGWWDCKGEENQVTSIFEGLLKKQNNSIQFTYAKGCDIDKFKKVGQSKIEEAVALAKTADIVIMVLGEEYWMSGEGGGVASLKLPGLQEELLAAVAKTGKPIITLITTSRPYILTDVVKKSTALVQVWHAGSTTGDAVSAILFGEYNPSAKLPVTFPYHQGQIPIFYSYKRTSHGFDAGKDNNRYSTTFRDVQNEPLFPFGYGLSYTNYEYSDIILSSDSFSSDEFLEVKVEVTNTGKMKGQEIVQLYLQDKVCSVVRPERELKDFKIVSLNPNETKEVVFKISKEKLSFIDVNYRKKIEPGEFIVFVGKNSRDTKQALFNYQLKK